MRLEPTFSLLEIPFNINMVSSSLVPTVRLVLWATQHQRTSLSHLVHNMTSLSCSFPVLQARDIMTERPGQATRLLYQLFIALNRKKVGTQTDSSKV